MVKLLLDVGQLWVNIRNTLGNTPLHYAVLYGDPNIVDILTKHGADINIRNEFRKTPIDIAWTLPHCPDISQFLRGQLVNWPEQSPFARTKHFLEEEKFACENTHIFVTEFLLSGGTERYWYLTISVMDLLYRDTTLEQMLNLARPESAIKMMPTCVWVHAPQNNVGKAMLRTRAFANDVSGS
jgi:hypothetical protein